MGTTLPCDGLRTIRAAVISNDDLTHNPVGIEEASGLANASFKGLAFIQAGEQDREFTGWMSEHF